MTFFFLFLLNNCWLCRDISYKIFHLIIYIIFLIYFIIIFQRNQSIFLQNIYIYKKETNIAQNYHKCIR